MTTVSLVNQLIYYAIPLFVITMILEALLVRGKDVRGYEKRDSAASLAMGLGNVAIAAGFKVLSFGVFVWLYQFRLFDIPQDLWVWPLIIVCDDFC